MCGAHEALTAITATATIPIAAVRPIRALQTVKSGISTAFPVEENTSRLPRVPAPRSAHQDALNLVTHQAQCPHYHAAAIGPHARLHRPVTDLLEEQVSVVQIEGSDRFELVENVTHALQRRSETRAIDDQRLFEYGNFWTSCLSSSP